MAARHARGCALPSAAPEPVTAALPADLRLAMQCAEPVKDRVLRMVARSNATAVASLVVMAGAVWLYDLAIACGRVEGVL